jgi:hypothetical protein
MSSAIGDGDGQGDVVPRAQHGPNGVIGEGT